MKNSAPTKKLRHRNDVFVVPIIVLGLLTVAVQPTIADPRSPTPSPSPSPTPSPSATPSPTPTTCVYPVTTGMVIASAGKNYTVGDRLRAIGGTSCIENFPFSLQVATVDTNGGVLTVNVILADSNGYVTNGQTPPTPIAFAGSATGSGFKVSGVTFASSP